MILNGKELKNCINAFEKTIIYIWRPNCSSSLCLPLETIQKVCNTNNIELFIIAEYYDYKKMNYYYSIQRPIFGIDIHYYKSDLTQVYVSKFIFDIIGKKENIKNDFFFLFNNGQLVSKGESIDKIGL